MARSPGISANDVRARLSCARVLVQLCELVDELFNLHRSNVPLQLRDSPVAYSVVSVDEGAPNLASLRMIAAYVENFQAKRTVQLLA